MSATTMQQVHRPQTNRSTDRIFFPVFTLLILAAVFRGFARTYFLAGMVHAPLPNALIHVHGALFTSWLVLLTVQTGLVSARRTDIHRKLGLFGFGLACCMVVVGLLAACDSLRRGTSPQQFPGGPLTFFIIPVTAILLFAAFIALSYRARSHDLAGHKRLIMLATVAILDAAIARWPYEFIQKGSHWNTDLICYSFLALMMIYDFSTTRRVHRTTLWGSVLIIVVQQIRVPLGLTAPWHAFAHWVLRFGI